MDGNEKIVRGGIYQHHKGRKYKLIDLVIHSETLEEMVLYEALYKNELGQFWVRPKSMFFEKTEEGFPRFKLVEEL